MMKIKSKINKKILKINKKILKIGNMKIKFLMRKWMIQIKKF